MHEISQKQKRLHAVVIADVHEFTGDRRPKNYVQTNDLLGVTCLTPIKCRCMLCYYQRGNVGVQTHTGRAQKINPLGKILYL